jgi:hypothetical protein
MKRASLYEDKWVMATAETMTSAGIAAASKVPDTATPADPYFCLNVPWRALAPHAGFCWWEATPDNPYHNLTLIREGMLAVLPPSPTDASMGDVTDSEQVNADVSPSDDDEKPTTEFPILNNKAVHIIAYGWDSKQSTFLDVIDAIESLQLPLTEELEPKRVGGMTRVDLHLACMDTYTWTILKLRSGWIPQGATSILLAFRVVVGDKATTGKHHAWCSLTAAGRHTLKPRNIPYDLQDLIQEQRSSF